MSKLTQNTLFYGDNLPIIREYLPHESVDLIYLDPPFNSQRTYNVLFKDESGLDAEAQIAAFKDTWHWNYEAELTYTHLVTQGPERLGRVVGALRQMIGANQMMAYLVMMGARLVELHHVLKPTGSLYLHCDPTASHYLKILLDAIFSPEKFRSEIIWKRTSAHNSAKRYGPIHDVLFFYTKTDEYVWNDQPQPYDESYLKKFYRHVEENGRRYQLGDLTGAGKRNGLTGQPWRGINPTDKNRHWMVPPSELDILEDAGLIYWPAKGNMPRLKRYLDEMTGIPLQDVWNDIPPLGAHAKERMGYPTQKPMALLERILLASSALGDVILDPFCGCGTTIAAAQKHGRNWVGIDITHLSIALMKYRLNEMFPEEPFTVIGEPTTVGAARQLAQDNRYQFQWWALSLVKARPLGGEEGSKKGKKGADKGIDGVIHFLDDPTAQPKRLLVQVKSGKVGSKEIRDLVGTLEREKGAMALFITLEEPTQPMVIEAAAAGLYHSPGWNQNYPKVQILTIEQLLEGARLNMPAQNQPGITFKQAERAKQSDVTQANLFE